MSFYSVCKTLFARCARILLRVRVVGCDNEPKDGTFLVCANHMSLADPVVLGAVLFHNPGFMAKKELFRVPLLRHVIKALGAYPVDRKNADISAIRHTVDLLRGGQSVVLFPQGTRQRGILPENTNVKNGCGMIALKADVPVLPVLLYTKNYRVVPFCRIYAVIGKPIPIDELRASQKQVHDYGAPSQLIFSRILSLEEQLP